MRSVLGQGLVVGVGVGAAAVIIRTALGSEPLHVQLLAVLCAGTVLAGIQLALSGRLTRPRRLPASREPAVRPPAAPAPPPRPETPLDSDTGWTGLAAGPPPAAHEPPASTEPLAESLVAQDAEPPG